VFYWNIEPMSSYEHMLAAALLATVCNIRKSGETSNVFQTSPYHC